MTAVIRRADAARHAWIMISISMSASLMSPGAVDMRMKTAVENHEPLPPKQISHVHVMRRGGGPSSSLTDSPTVTAVSWFE